MLEGVAYGLRDSLELLRSLGARAGGGPRVGRRRTQRALAADRRLGARPPARADGVRGGSAFGAALLAGVRAGVFADAHEAVARCVRAPRADRARCRDYQDGYERFRRLYPALRPLEDS